MATLIKIYLLLLALLAVVQAQLDIRVPPNISDPDRPKKLYYKENTNVVVKCQATGTPTPTYRWMFKGKPIVANQPMSYDSVTGDLTISKFSQPQEGLYMCIASNTFDNDSGGRITAASFSPPCRSVPNTDKGQSSKVQDIDDKGRLGEFPEIPDRTISTTEYKYVFLDCSDKGEIVSLGNETFSKWYKAKGAEQLSMDGGRLFVDQTGNLHFSYVLRGDATLDFKYSCGVSISGETDIIGTKFGNVHHLTVQNVSNPSAIAPQLQYHNSGVKGRLFGSAKLECVFSGYDPVAPHIPVTKWYDDAGVEIANSNNKYTLSSEGRRLTIKDLQENDEKNYYCQAENSAGKSAREAVFLDVTSASIFLNAGRPVDTIVPENSDVEFRCDARSTSKEQEPHAPIWYINGSPTGSHTDRTKFVLSPDRKSLTVKKVLKATDILCVQCEVSNHEGTTWGDGCLNVLLPIKLINQPEEKQVIEKGDTVDLTVTAISDPAPFLSLSYRCEFKNQTCEGSDKPPHVFYDPTTLLAYINTSMLTNEEYDSIRGTYHRYVYHDFETKRVDIKVVLKGQETGGVVSKGGFDMRISGLIIVIIVIIIIFVICRKKQEGDYNVDKKETGVGLDPEKELKDKSFSDYSRPDLDDYDYPDQKPRGDLEYDDVPIGGDDESLGEYGDEDDTHFNEDGSFIGV